MLYKYTAMKCTIVRTHEKGHTLRDTAFGPAVEGPVEMSSYYHDGLRRYVEVLSVVRRHHGGASKTSLIPDLHEPHLVTFGSEAQAMMVSGWEEIHGQRYYQGWYVRFFP